MWQINTTTLRLEWVADTAQHKYVVLSHTWQAGQEVTYQEFISSERDLSSPRFDKIIQTCHKAEAMGIQYAWVDTCCIDKSSSAELAEAINAMFTWYKDSSICFVYLCDLPKEERPGTVDLDTKLMRKCNWFRRGWTLQELIAPQQVLFYDTGWNLRARKSSMLPTLSTITRIDERVLADSSLLPSIPVAKRMSWASSRQTTREEDIAYCLFGIFDIHLPLIYGEGGRKAFIRLQ